METPESLQRALTDWSGVEAPPRLDDVKASPGYQALPPAARIEALNQTQRNAANWLRAKAPEMGLAYGDIARDMEEDFNQNRAEEVRAGLAEDLRNGALSEEDIAAYLKGGQQALVSRGEAAGYVQQRYGADAAQRGPWQTVKLPVTGADGTPVGYSYVRHAPGKDHVEVSWSLHGNDGKDIKGTEDVSATESMTPARNTVAQRDAYYGANTGQGADTTFGPGAPYPDNLKAIASEYESTPEALRPFIYGARAASARLQANPEVVNKVGQGFWAGAPGGALKGLLNLGAAVVHGPGALTGSGESVENWRQGTADINSAIEGQSRLSFQGGRLNNALKGLTEESIPLALSAGSGAVASLARRGLASAVGKSFLSRMAALEMNTALRQMSSAAGREGMAKAIAAEFTGEGVGRSAAQAFTESIGRGLFGKWLGTAEIEGKLAKELADRVTNAVTFLPSSARSGLQNMAQTFDAADALRKQGQPEAAAEIEGRAVLNGWAGIGLETLSENMWLNEMMVTRTGRPLADVATESLARSLKPGLMAELTRRAGAALAKGVKSGAQEGVEEVAAGVGIRAWMNTFAGQNEDLLKDVPQEFLTGALMGAVMGAAKGMAQNGKPAVFNELLLRGLEHDPAAVAALEDIRKRASTPPETRAALENLLPTKPPAVSVEGAQGAPAAPPENGTAAEAVPFPGGSVTRLPGMLGAASPAPVEEAPAEAPPAAPAPAPVAEAPPVLDPVSETPPAGMADDGESLVPLAALEQAFRTATGTAGPPEATLFPDPEAAQEATPAALEQAFRNAAGVNDPLSSPAPDERPSPAVPTEQTGPPQPGPFPREAPASVVRAGEEITPGTTDAPPVPDTAETVAEQVRLAADPQSTRRAVLITPGTPRPPKTPGLKAYQGDTNGHGTVLYNPAKVTPREIREAVKGKVFDARVLGLSGQPVASGTVAVTASTPAAPNVQAELVNTPAQLPEAIAAAQAAAPGATVEVKPAEQVLAERAAGQAAETAPAEPSGAILQHVVKDGKVVTESQTLDDAALQTRLKEHSRMLAVYQKLLDCLTS
jgi:hypothetical protein